MLRNIILILTEDYKEKISGSVEYFAFKEEMRKHGTAVELCGIKDIDWSMGNANNLLKEDGESLYFSDYAQMLSWLQEQRKFTVAMYHEGVSGLLGGTQFAIEDMKDVEWEYLYKVYQRFVNEPWSIAQTARCNIREMGLADVDELYELYEGPNVTRYMEALFPKKEQEEQYIKDYIENVYKYYGFGIWLIHRKEDGRLIGRAGFNYRPGYEEVELGFMIGEAFWRQGYAFEVCSHLMNLAGSVYEFERVQALVKKENTASIQLLEKLGFTYFEEVNLDGEVYQRYLSELAL